MNKIFGFRSFGVVVFLAMIAVFSVAALFLWNALMPEIFGLPVLTYWQAAGLVILARILFGGLGTGRFGPHGHGGFHHGNALREKWQNMSADERTEFLRGRREFSHLHEFFNEPPGRCGRDAPNNEGGKNE